MAAATGQDFTTFAGDQAIPRWYVTDGNNNPVNISAVTEIVVTVSRNLDDETSTVVQKKLSLGGCAIVNGPAGIFSATFLTADTEDLTLAYDYIATTTDPTNGVTTVATGQMIVKPKPAASNSGDPAQSARDFARVLVGDANPNSPYLTDQVYDMLASNFGGPLYVAAQAARMIGAQFSAKVSKSVGPLRIQYSDIAKNFSALASALQSQADMGSGIYAAGISKSDMQGYSRRNNPDVVMAFTTLKAFDNRGAAGGFMPENTGGDP